MVFYAGDTPLSYGAASMRSNGSSTTYRYREITHQVRRSGKCPACGKRRTRQATFTATQNPFNKDPETGEPRTPQQIRVELQTQAEQWTPDFTCSTCDSEVTP